MTKNLLTLLASSLFVLTFHSLLQGQSCYNHINQLEIEPASCGNDNGSISVIANSPNRTFEWEDGSTNPDRTGLASGIYTVISTDEKGCREELILEVPSIKECDFQTFPEYILGPTGGEQGGRKPCIYYRVVGTINGQPTDPELFYYSWHVVPPYPNSPYYSYEPTVPIYFDYSVVYLNVYLADGEGNALSCCSYNTTIYPGRVCRRKGGDVKGGTDIKGDGRKLVNGNNRQNLIMTPSEKQKVESFSLSLDVRPNPFQEYLNVSYQSTTQGQGTIRIYNNQGMLIHLREVYCDGSKQEKRIDFGSFDANGLYFIQFNAPDSKTKTTRAILMKKN
ncbi:MAG: T9SS type A sorting domain-containing protein [Bacteroidota bacterium]